jgi:hypothetical protein
MECPTKTGRSFPLARFLLLLFINMQFVFPPIKTPDQFLLLTPLLTPRVPTQRGNLRLHGFIDASLRVNFRPLH